jgi:ribose transport system ATP-binding protein
VTVLRDGEVIVTRSAKGLDHQTLVSLIVGRRLKQMEESHIPHRQEETVLEALAVSGRLVEDVSFVLNRGEVLGLAGLAGSGREELPYLIGGAAQLDSGSLCLDGETLGRLTPRAALGAGLVLVGADRQRQSAIPALMVRENLCLPRLETHGPLRWVGIRRERRTSMQWIERLEVRPREPDRMLATYSGGNQQKVVLARALRLQPRVLILDEPAQGIDVGAKVALFTHLSEVAASGLPILVASSDPEDLATVCDRVLVLRGGRVGAELDGENLTTDRIVEETLGPVPTEA